MAAAPADGAEVEEDDGTGDAFHIRLLETGDVVKIYDVDLDDGISPDMVMPGATQPAPSADLDIDALVGSTPFESAAADGSSVVGGSHDRLPQHDSEPAELHLTTPAGSAAGMHPGLLLPLGEGVEALLAGHVDVREARTSHVVYVVLIARDDTRRAAACETPPVWTVFRRYRHFRALYEALRKAGVPVPGQFPSKQKWLTQSDADFLAKRQSGLQAWLAALVAAPSSSSARLPLLTKELHSFITEHADMMPQGLNTAQYRALAVSLNAAASAAFFPHSPHPQQSHSGGVLLASAAVGIARAAGGTTPPAAEHDGDSHSGDETVSVASADAGGGRGSNLSGPVGAAPSSSSSSQRSTPSASGFLRGGGGGGGSASAAALVGTAPSSIITPMHSATSGPATVLGDSSAEASPVAAASPVATAPLSARGPRGPVTLVPLASPSSISAAALLPSPRLASPAASSSAATRGGGLAGPLQGLSGSSPSSVAASPLSSPTHVQPKQQQLAAAAATAAVAVQHHASGHVTHLAAYAASPREEDHRVTHLAAPVASTHMQVVFPRAGVVLAPVVTSAAANSAGPVISGAHSSSSAPGVVSPGPASPPPAGAKPASGQLPSPQGAAGQHGAHFDHGSSPHRAAAPPSSGAAASPVSPPPPEPPAAGAAAAAVPHRPRICLDDFELLKVIGKGSFGKVLLVRKKEPAEAAGAGGYDAAPAAAAAASRAPRRVFAMKVLSKPNIVKRKQVEHTATERRVLGYAKHPFIVTLHYAFQCRKKLFLVMDYAGGGELFYHLGRWKKFPQPMAAFYAAELVLALGFLHKNKVVYRDLKPENVLLDDEGHIKVADFGLSKEGISASTEGTRSFCGTPEYLAPEVLNRAGHGTAVDWWSLGALIYEMLTGLPPWYTQDRKKLYERLRSAPLEFPDYVSPVARALIGGLLTRDPAARLGSRRDAAEIMAHPFFAGLDWRALYRRQLAPPFAPGTEKAAAAAAASAAAVAAAAASGSAAAAAVASDAAALAADVRYFDKQFTALPPTTAMDDDEGDAAGDGASARRVAAAAAAAGGDAAAAAELGRMSSVGSVPPSLFPDFTYESPGALAGALAGGSAGGGASAFSRTSRGQSLMGAAALGLLSSGGGTPTTPSLMGGGGTPLSGGLVGSPSDGQLVLLAQSSYSPPGGGASIPTPPASASSTRPATLAAPAAPQQQHYPPARQPIGPMPAGALGGRATLAGGAASSSALPLLALLPLVPGGGGSGGGGSSARSDHGGASSSHLPQHPHLQQRSPSPAVPIPSPPGYRAAPAGLQRSASSTPMQMHQQHLHISSGPESCGGSARGPVSGGRGSPAGYPAQTQQQYGRPATAAGGYASYASAAPLTSASSAAAPPLGYGGCTAYSGSSGAGTVYVYGGQAHGAVSMYGSGGSGDGSGGRLAVAGGAALHGSMASHPSAPSHHPGSPSPGPGTRASPYQYHPSLNIPLQQQQQPPPPPPAASPMYEAAAGGGRSTGERSTPTPPPAAIAPVPAGAAAGPASARYGGGSSGGFYGFPSGGSSGGSSVSTLPALQRPVPSPRGAPPAAPQHHASHHTLLPVASPRGGVPVAAAAHHRSLHATASSPALLAAAAAVPGGGGGPLHPRTGGSSAVSSSGSPARR